MPLSPSESLRRKVRLAVHGVCMRQHRQEGSGSDLDAELAGLFAREDAQPPEEPVLQQWVDEDQADFDRAVLISKLVAQAQPRIESAPAAAVVAARPREREQSVRAPEAAAPPSQARPSGGSPSVADLLDGMFAQQGRR